MSFASIVKGIGQVAVPILSGIASLLLGGNLIFNDNANVAMKLVNSTSWVPIALFGQGAVAALHTNLEITGAPPLAEGYLYQWDRGEQDAQYGEYGVIAATNPAGIFDAHMPTQCTVAVVLKQGRPALEFNGSGAFDTPNLSTLPPNNSGGQFQQKLGQGQINGGSGSAWGDPEEMIDAKRAYLTGYDHHVSFCGGFMNGDDRYTADKLSRTNQGDMLIVVAFASDAPPTVQTYPNQWQASDPSLNFGMVTGTVSYIWTPGSAASMVGPG